MEYIDKIKKMLCRELEEYATKGKLTLADVDVVHKLSDTVKNLHKIEMLEDKGYSERTHDGRYYGGASYDDEYSERRYAKRDSMGRYSSDGAKDYMMSKLGEMMENADPNEREILKDAMRRIEKA
jgi:predicted xylose isomerase-like sugar epimerase